MSATMVKGAALVTAFTAALGKICLAQDAYLKSDPNQYSLVIGSIVEGKDDVVFGSRFQPAAPNRMVNCLYMLMSNGLADLIS